MARDAFFRDVRSAVSFMAPRVETDSPFTDGNYIDKMLKGTDMWLAQPVVAAFRPEDFSDLDDRGREELTHAVDEFRTVARSVPAKESAKNGQRDAALQPFKVIVQIVQRLVHADWNLAANKLLAEAEGWAKEADWPCK